RYAEFALFAGILVYFEHRIAAQLLVFAALAGSLLVTYSTAKAEALHLAPPRGLMKRSDRMACLVVGSVLSPVLDRWTGGLWADRDWHPWPLLVAIAAIAVFGNLSAIARFAFLSNSARSRKTL